MVPYLFTSSYYVRLAFRPSGGAPKAPQLATTIASSSTTLAPTPHRQRLTTVGGWCDPIIQPFLGRFQPSVSIFRRSCGPKTLEWQNLVFWTQNEQRTHHKVGTARPLKAIQAFDRNCARAEMMRPPHVRAHLPPCKSSLSFFSKKIF
jgi:hypothetical protein